MENAFINVVFVCRMKLETDVPSHTKESLPSCICQEWGDRITSYTSYIDRITETHLSGGTGLLYIDRISETHLAKRELGTKSKPEVGATLCQKQSLLSG